MNIKFIILFLFISLPIFGQGWQNNVYCNDPYGDYIEIRHDTLFIYSQNETWDDTNIITFISYEKRVKLKSYVLDDNPFVTYIPKFNKKIIFKHDNLIIYSIINDKYYFHLDIINNDKLR